MKPRAFLEQNSRKVMIATPLKNAREHLGRYAAALSSLLYPKELLSVAFLVSDSVDGTAELARQLSHTTFKDFAKVQVVEESFEYEAPTDRHALSVQAKRRAVLARSRNELLKHALDDDIFAVL